MEFTRIYICILILFLASAGINAQSALEDTIALEDVTIGIIPFGDRNRATGGISIIKTEIGGIDNTINIEGIVNQVPGVFMASGGYNTNRLVIRGVGSRTPYSTNRIRAYLDDIPLTTGDGISNLEEIDISAIGNIEILKGPSSAIYGSGLGGVVKISSRYPEKSGFSANLNYEYGSFGTFRTYANTAYKKRKFSLSAGYARSSSNGYRENSRYLRNNFLINANFFGNSNQLSVTINYVDLYAQIPSSLNEEDFTNNPEKAAENWLAVKGFESYNKIMGGISLKTDFSGSLRNKLVIFSSFNDPYESRPFNILDDRSIVTGIRDLLQLTVKDLKISTGIEYFYENYHWQIYETGEGNRGMLLTDNKEGRQFMNLMAYGHYEPAGALTVDLGLNLNILNYDLVTEFNADSSDQTGSYRYDPVLSPRLGINYRYLHDHFIYFSAGHGFSAPSAEETLLPEGTLNNALKPETGWNLEIGNRSAFLQSRLRTDVDIYMIYLRNLLVTKRITEDIFTGINAGSAVNMGMEVQCDYSLLSPSLQDKYRIDMSVNYAISKNRFLDFIDDNIDYSGKELPGIPRQILHLTMSASFHQKIFLQIEHRFTGKQYMDDANTVINDAYHLSGIRLSVEESFKNIPLDIRFYGGIRNMFNSHYASMILVNAPSFGTVPPRYYYPGLPRNFYIGLTLMIR